MQTERADTPVIPDRTASRRSLGRKGLRHILQRLSVKLALGICAALLLIAALFFVQQYRLHRFHLIDSLKDSLTQQGSLIAKGLEFAMLENHPSITQEMVEALARDPGVQKVWILDKQGTIRAASERSSLGEQLSVADRTCQICHSKSLGERSRTIIFTTENGTELFRNVIAIRNREQCYACHKPSSKLNGVLIIDYALAGIRQELRSNLWTMARLALFMLAAIVVVIAFLANRLVLGKVRVLERAAKQVQSGDLHARAEIKGTDEISFLAQHFNQMTSSLKASIERSEAQKRYLEKLIDSIDDGVVVMDRDCRVLMANRSYATRFGPASENLDEEGCCALSHKFLRPCENASFDCPAKESFEQGIMCMTVHCFEGDEGKGEFWEIHASPVKDERGEVTQVVEVIRDITQRKTLEQRLSHSERLASLGIMASGICHELNNPLASVTACLDGLQRRLREKTEPKGGRLNEIAEYIELIQKEIERCKDLSGKLLTLSEKPKAKLDRLDLHRVLCETLALFRERADARGIKILTELSPGPSTIQADEGQIRQVLHNLILNALEAVDRHGEIRIGTRVLGDRLTVEIEDTGIGIEAETLPRIFEPFFTKTRDGRGTGLGLTICESIVRQHRGDIRVQSHVGRGTRVTLVLPLDPESMEKDHRTV